MKQLAASQNLQILISVLPGAVLMGALIALSASMAPAFTLVLCFALAGLIALLVAADIELVLTVSLAASLFNELISVLIDVYWFPIVFDGMLLVCAVFLILKRSALPARHSRLDWYLLCWLGFVGVGAIQLFNGNQPSLVAGLQGFRYLVFESLALIVGVMCFHSKASFDRLWRWIALAGIPVMLNAIRQRFLWWPIDDMFVSSARARDPFYLGSTGIIRRSFGFFPSPFTLGMFGVIVVLVGLYFAYGHRSRRWWIVVLLGAIGTLSSLTRSTAFSLIVSTSVFLLAAAGPTGGKWARSILAIAAIVALLFVVLNIMPDMPEYLRTLTRFWADPHFVGRPSAWRLSWQLILQRPIVGYGVGSTASALGSLYDSGSSMWLVPHNLLLTLVIELGVIGAGLFLVLVTYPTMKAIARVRSTALVAHMRLSMSLCLSIVASFCVQGLAGTAIEAFPVNVWFWFCVGVLLRLSSLPREHEPCVGDVVGNEHQSSALAEQDPAEPAALGPPGMRRSRLLLAVVGGGHESTVLDLHGAEERSQAGTALQNSHVCLRRIATVQIEEQIDPFTLKCLVYTGSAPIG